MPNTGQTGTPLGAVFLSYASQDAEAAKRICEALRATGIEVWFDQSELRGGDVWDSKIKKQIKNCALFLPVISTHTQERSEGYFRREWNLATQRVLDMAHDAAFMVPIVIDGTRDAEARVPDEFLRVQWTRLPGGVTPAAFGERVKGLLSGPEMEPTHQIPATGSSSWVLHPVRRSHPWLYPAIFGIVACVVLAIWHPWHKREEPSASAPGSESKTEIDQLLERATAMTTVDATLDDLSAEDYKTAEKLIEQAKALDPLNGEVWAREAINDVNYVRYLGYDDPGVHKERASVEAARAIELSPNSYAARLAHAQVIVWVVAPTGGSHEAELLVRELLKERPTDQEAQITLGETLGFEGRLVEAGQFYLSVKLPLLAGWAYYNNGQVAEANAAADQALAMKRSLKNLELKIFVMALMEDRNAVLSLLAEIPQSAYTNDEAVFALASWGVEFHDPVKTLEILESFPRDWINTSYNGSVPKGWFAGVAHMIAGRPEAARAEWSVALRQIEQKLAENPNDPVLLYDKADLLAYSGQREEALRALRLCQQLLGQDDTSITSANYDLLLRIGQRRDAVVAWIEDGLRNPKRDNRILHADARFGYGCDPLRGDPRFEKLLRDTLPKYAKPFDEPAAGGAPATGSGR